ncbi:hypothetical protein M422DRAFT_33759 [Sphaerobolus stellatus SS14]|uniref:Enoyl reductase (ER) domain-containing protein n=1 Tax=Sphaerobolus stellatus (strain SS14) TaxID=990650 RepID=A0A0C9U3M3_SPHS4|nr:hypothetical protein M422DRAFT_33759 [Sphaerobolus stellatus SS14]
MTITLPRLSSSSSSSSVAELSSPSPKRKPQGDWADWSKDVRWLVPPTQSQSRPLSMRSTSSASSSSSLGPAALHPEVSHLHGMELVNIENEPSRSRRRTTTGRKKVRSQMSAVWEEEEVPVNKSNNTIPAHSSPLNPANRFRTVSAPLDSFSLSSTSTTTTTTHHTVTVPVPLPVSSGDMPYGSLQTLTLPRAFRPSSSPDLSSGRVDLISSGKAQTTMSAIAVTRRHTSSSKSTPQHLQDDIADSLGLTAHKQPPSYVPPRSVLIQVHAVALDALDLLLLTNRSSKKSGYDFVPGRSFVGQVIEVGWDTKKVGKGDWVCGLADVKSCGALAQFLVIDNRRVHPLPIHSGLTTDQAALLPLAGIPAHRAVNCLRHLPTDSLILILNAHSGAGLLATQELVALGYSRVWAHVPGECGSEAELRVSKIGVDVFCGDVIDVMERTKVMFDAIVDTVGGKAVWKAARKVLLSNSTFITLVGDIPASALSSFTYFKANMRILRRSWFQSVEYTWISAAADLDLHGDSVRDTLADVVELVRMGKIRPFVAGSVGAEGNFIPVAAEARLVSKEDKKKGKARSLKLAGEEGKDGDWIEGFEKALSKAKISERRRGKLRESVALDQVSEHSQDAAPDKGAGKLKGPKATKTHVDVEGLVFKFERAHEAFGFNLRTGERLLGGGGTAVVRVLE